MMDVNNSSSNDLSDTNYYGFANGSDDEEEEEKEQEKIGMSQTIYNINLQEGRNYEDIQHPDHPDLNSNYLLVYLHYQHKLYSQIYGIEAIESDDIQQFKDSLKNLI